MHPRILAARRMAAGQRIGEGLAKLAAMLGVSPSPIRSCKDAQSAELLSLEAWAVTLGELVDQVEVLVTERRVRDDRSVALGSRKGKK